MRWLWLFRRAAWSEFSNKGLTQFGAPTAAVLHQEAGDLPDTFDNSSIDD